MIFGWLKRLFPEKAPIPRGAVQFDERCINVRTINEITWSIEWDDIRVIETWKDDLFSNDEVVLGFSIGSDCSVWCVYEDMDGFGALTEELRRRFESLPPDWYSKVCRPPFQENRTTIYQRDVPSDS